MLDTTPPPQIGSDLPPNTKNRQNPPPLQCKHMQKPCPPSPGRQHPVGTPKPCTHGTHMHPSHSCRAGTGWGGDSWQRTPPPLPAQGSPCSRVAKSTMEKRVHPGERAAGRQQARAGEEGERSPPPCAIGDGDTPATGMSPLVTCSPCGTGKARGTAGCWGGCGGREIPPSIPRVGRGTPHGTAEQALGTWPAKAPSGVQPLAPKPALGLGGWGGGSSLPTPPHPSGCKPPGPSPLCHSGPDPKAPAAPGSSGRGLWHVPVVPGPAPRPTHYGDRGGPGGPPHQDRSRRPCRSCRALCRLNPGCRGSPSRRCPDGTGGGGGPRGQAVGWAPPPGGSPRPAAPRAPGTDPGWEKQPHRARTDGWVSGGGC